MRLLLIGRGTQGRAGMHLEPFADWHRAIRHKLNIRLNRVDVQSLAETEWAVEANPADVAMIMVHWSESPGDVVAMFERLHARSPRPKLIFLDWFDQASSPFFGVLPFVGAYVKRQLLRDRALYLHEFAGGTPFTDFYTWHFDYDLAGWHFGSSPSADQLHKLHLGWGLGVQTDFRRASKFNHWINVRWDRRSFDLNARIGMGKPERHEWYQDYRRRVIDQMGRLGGRFTVTGTERISSQAYWKEMRRSRIAFSPFGWGEVCLRDFEAVCSGALLLKPSMAHIETRPNIYSENETYIAVEWDLSDLEEKCARCLEHPEEAQRIAQKAHRIYAGYFESDGFLDDLRRILAAVD